MRELDELLLKHLENDYPHASAEDKAAFREVLALSDPEIRAYLLGGEKTGKTATDRVIGQMRH